MAAVGDVGGARRASASLIKSERPVVDAPAAPGVALARPRDSAPANIRLALTENAATNYLHHQQHSVKNLKL